MAERGKKGVDFNNFRGFIFGYAERRGINRTDFSLRSKVDISRISQMANGKRDISVYYFLKLIGGMRMNAEAITEKSGISYTDEQTRELEFFDKVELERDLIEMLLADEVRLATLKKEYGM